MTGWAAAADDHHLNYRQVRYGSDGEQVAEVLCPRAAHGPRGLVIVIHGGFWRERHDRHHTLAQCLALARAGHAVAAVEYRRVGGAGGWPTTFTDVAAAVDALPGLLTGGRGERAVVMGHSAGGHLALWAAARHRLASAAPGHRRHRPPILGVLALAPVADLRWAAAAGLGDGAVRDLLDGAPRERPGRYAAADPTRLVPSGVPTLVLHGDADTHVPLACARSYVEAARAVGDPVALRELPGVGHFEVIDPTSTAWPAVRSALHELLGR